MGIKNVEPSLLPVPLSKAFELAHVIRTSNEDPTLYVYTLNPLYIKYIERVACIPTYNMASIVTMF
jgi:hypothetical protein